MRKANRTKNIKTQNISTQNVSTQSAITDGTVAKNEVPASIFVFLGFLTVGILTICASAHAQEYASTDRSSAALGHYARARSMLVEALAEFEEGRRLASPDMLIDSDLWRLNIVSRTEELNRVIDPKPRVTRNGIRFDENPRQIRHDLNSHKKRASKAQSAKFEPALSSNKPQPRARLANRAASNSEDARLKELELKLTGTSTDSANNNQNSSVKNNVAPNQPARQAVSNDIISSIAKDTISKEVAQKDSELQNKDLPSTKDKQILNDTAVQPQAEQTKDVQKQTQNDSLDPEVSAVLNKFSTNNKQEDPELLAEIQAAVENRLKQQGNGAPTK